MRVIDRQEKGMGKQKKNNNSSSREKGVGERKGLIGEEVDPANFGIPHVSSISVLSVGGQNVLYAQQV